MASKLLKWFSKPSDIGCADCLCMYAENSKLGEPEPKIVPCSFKAGHLQRRELESGRVEESREACSTLEVLKFAVCDKSFRGNEGQVCQATIRSNSKFGAICRWVVQRHCTSKIASDAKAAATPSFRP